MLDDRIRSTANARAHVPEPAAAAVEHLQRRDGADSPFNGRFQRTSPSSLLDVRRPPASAPASSKVTPSPKRYAFPLQRICQRRIATSINRGSNSTAGRTRPVDCAAIRVVRRKGSQIAWPVLLLLRSDGIPAWCWVLYRRRPIENVGKSPNLLASGMRPTYSQENSTMPSHSHSAANG